MVLYVLKTRTTQFYLLLVHQVFLGPFLHFICPHKPRIEWQDGLTISYLLLVNILSHFHLI